MISLNWVKDYIDLSGEDLTLLAKKITKAGINVEKVITNHIDNLVIGEVLECTNHPDSDHLHVLKVDVGSDVLQIVCGASNIASGLKVIVAKVGAVLPGNFEIKKSSIRGVESNGMICALFELGLEEKTKENYDKGICILDNSAKVGTDPLEYLGLDDTLYDLDIHKHRNNDCYYHIGFAYEIACILNKKVTLPETKYKCIEDSINNYMKLDVQTNKCSYYLGKIVKDVKVKESPEFIKKRLLSAGMRSINNVVDISNYVMLEFGQPLHFFDYDKLGNNVVVKDSNNEVITTLDSKERTLTCDDIVITDGVKPVCIAGVMGGLDTEITDSTKNIFIESAIFDPVSIRNTAARLNLKSEASIRYGKGLNFEYTNMAINRACYLLEKYADAKILSGVLKHDNVVKDLKKVTFKASDINKMLGINISIEDMKKELSRLDFEYELDGEVFTTTIPRRRLDIDANVNDIAEEIGRLYGYQNLVSTLPVVEIKKGEYKGDVKYRKEVSKRLRTLGLDEAKTYTLVSPNMASLFNYNNLDNIVLPNPMSVDKSVIRTTLIPSLINVYDYNKSRKVNDINIYEIAKTYDSNYKENTKITVLMSGNYISNNWSGNKIKVDFYLIKGILENLLDYMGFKNRYSIVADNSIPSMHPYMSARILLDREPIGIIGRIHPSVKKDEIYTFEISLNSLIKTIKPLKYKASSKYPEIVKDLSFVMDKNTTSKEIMEVIKKSGGRLLTNIDVFDVYTGEKVSDNEKSIAYSLTFSDPTKTLSDDEVMVVFNKIINDVESKTNSKLRSI